MNVVFISSGLPWNHDSTSQSNLQVSFIEKMNENIINYSSLDVNELPEAFWLQSCMRLYYGLIMDLHLEDCFKRMSIDLYY